MLIPLALSIDLRFTGLDVFAPLFFTSVPGVSIYPL